MKLILFDIDGTLVLTGGAGMRAMNRTFAALDGVERALEGIPLAGRTDRVIVEDAVARLNRGIVIDPVWLDGFRRMYFELLEEELASGTNTGKRVLPGVRELLDLLAPRSDVRLALLTGNFSEAARIKLSHFDLWDYFPYGAYGDDHSDRNLLLEVALQAARDRAVAIAAERAYVIGDTPSDVACARSGGARAIAVATGIHSVGELRAAGAHVVFEDLADLATVLREGLGIHPASDGSVTCLTP